MSNLEPYKPISNQPMVLVQSARYGWASIWPEDIKEIVCHRLKDHVEQYLVEWAGDWPTSTPYSWHTVRELSGGRTGQPNALALLQDYVETFRKQKTKRRAIAGQKRKSPDGEEHLYLNAVVDRLASDHLASESSGRSSPASDLSRDSLTSDDDQDCYNCKLVVKNERITLEHVRLPLQSLLSIHAHIVKFPNQSFTQLPTSSMVARAHKAPTTAADSAIRIEFDRLLSRIPEPKIKHINTRDASTPSLHFRFVESYVYGEGVEPPNSDLVIGCTSCKPNMGGFCGCEYTKRCECLEYARVDEAKLSEDERRKYEKVIKEGGSTMGFPKNFPYSKETGLMVKAYLGYRYPIYECNEKCGCGEVCKTRVVQRGRKVGLEIFKTKDRGWGLRSTENLQRGQFVDCYRGEVITNAEADRREEAADKGKESYLFSLDKFAEVVPDRNKDNMCVVDGEFVGGVTRFINHSCEPNCAQYAVCYDRNNPYIYDIAIFVTRAIPKGEELTFDYMDVDLEDEESKERLGDMLDKKVEADSIPCRCGAVNCRRWLWK